MFSAQIKGNCTGKLIRLDTVNVEKFKRKDKILSYLVQLGRIIMKYLNIVVG